MNEQENGFPQVTESIESAVEAPAAPVSEGESAQTDAADVTAPVDAQADAAVVYPQDAAVVYPQEEPHVFTEKPKKKRRLGLIITLSAVGVLLVAIAVLTALLINNQMSVEALFLNRNAMVLEEESSVLLEYAVTPEDIPLILKKWESSDPAVATVDGSGNVTAAAPGTCTVTLTALNGVQSVCDVTVKAHLEALSLSETSWTMEEQMTKSLTYKLTPEDAYFENAVWSSSNEAVATVSDNGALLAKAPGTCVISLTSADGKTATCNLTVKKHVPNFRELYASYASKSWCDIATDGSYMELDTNPYDYDSDSTSYLLWAYLNLDDAWNTIQQVNKKLGFSEALTRRMGNTTALSGTQTDENTYYRVSWTYHPDHGLEVLYEMKPQ